MLEILPIFGILPYVGDIARCWEYYQMFGILPDVEDITKCWGYYRMQIIVLSVFFRSDISLLSALLIEPPKDDGGAEINRYVVELDDGQGKMTWSSTFGLSVP